jgi:hypothetical protein
MPLDAIVQKEGWRKAQLMDMYPTHMLVLMYANWLKKGIGTYCNKKLMFLVTNVEKRKKMNWVGIVLNNLYKRLKDMFKPIKS